MKKVILLASFLGAALLTNAQVSFGPKIGLGLSNYSYSISDADQIDQIPAGKTTFSPTVGVALNIKFNNYFALQPGLQYAMLGSRLEEELSFFGVDMSIKAKQTTHNIQLPVLVKVQYPVSDNFAIGLGVGPYLGYLVGGSTKVTVKASAFGVSEEETTTSKIKGKSTLTESDFEDSETSFMNPLDFGIVIAPYVEIGHFQLALNYNLGLSNLSSKYDGKDVGGLNTKNQWYGITAAYFFGGK